MKLVVALIAALAMSSIVDAQAIPGTPTQQPSPQQPRGGGNSGGFGGIGLSIKLGAKKKLPEEKLTGPALQMQDSDIPDHAPGQVLFFIKASPTKVAKACKLTISETAALGELGTTMIVASFVAPATDQSVQACLTKQPGVESAQPNYHYQLLGGAGGTGGGSRSKGYALHGLKDGNPTPVKGTIVLIDTAVDTAHANLKAASIAQFLFDVPATPSAHGTAIAELLVGGGNYPGTAQGATLISYAAFAPAGENKWLSQSSSLAKALNAAAGLAPQVVNLSFGRSGPDPIITKALDIFKAKGMCVVAAAGNGSGGPVLFPATHSASLAVTAVDGKLRPYAYASKGPQISVAAWGVDVAAAVPGGRRSVSGTSFATAVIAGNLLRMAQCNGGRNPAGMKAAAMANAQDLGDKGADAVFGAGLFRLGGGKK